VIASEKVQLAIIRSRPRAFQRGIDEPCTLSPKVPQRVARKRDIAVCASKIQLISKKSATKFLCVKTSSGKVVATSFPYPTVHRPIAGDVIIYLKLAFKVTHPFRKRRFRKVSFNSASAVTASTDAFCDRNLAQRRYSQVITHSEGVKMTNSLLRYLWSKLTLWRRLVEYSTCAMSS